MKEILIFCPNPSPRLKFVLDFIFQDFTQKQYDITENLDAYDAFSGPKINYSPTSAQVNEIWIQPQGILQQSGIEKIAPEVSWINNEPLLFPSVPNPPNSNNAFPFDILAAIFFMLTRYEEYNNSEKDQYGRFPAKASLAMQHGFLKLPVVDLWLTALLQKIQRQFPGFVYPRRKMHIQFTYDIDVAFAYKGRSLLRNMASLAKDMLSLDFKNIVHKIRTFAGCASDPFDTYDYITKTSIDPLFFFLIHNKKTTYDRNISPHSKKLQTLIKNLSNTHSFGIHPSFYTSIKKGKLAAEKHIIETITGTAVCKSRQHYLKFSLPDTYRLLIDNTITEDYSMAFAEVPGFRAGTCTPFYFFDVERDTATKLKLFPSCIMESTFRDDIIIPASEAFPHFIQFFETVKKVGGHFIPIWHNDTLRTYKNKNHPKNFQQLHNDLVQYIRNTNNALAD